MMILPSAELHRESETQIEEGESVREGREGREVCECEACVREA